MNNPFLHRESDKGTSDYLTSNCSINRIRIAKLPVHGIDDEIEGLTVKEFFSTKLVIEEIKKNAQVLGIELEGVNEKKLPRKLAKCLESENAEIANEAMKIVKKFGNRLGLLFLTLKVGDAANRAARDDWNDEHWEYWSQIKDIILAGGLAAGRLGEELKKQAEYVFSVYGIEPYNIILYDNSSDVGVLGCSTQISNKNGVSVVMDFGQTSIKRCVVTKQDGEVTEIKTLEPYPSIFMEWEVESEEEKLRQAKKLHKYLLKAIVDTYNTAKAISGSEPNNEIVISIASYVINGRLNSERGGYAKLCCLGKNYAELLWWELSGILRKDVMVKLIHDGTAAALNFHDRKDTVCLSIGSYFGIGFPETGLVFPYK